MSHRVSERLSLHRLIAASLISGAAAWLGGCYDEPFELTSAPVVNRTEATKAAGIRPEEQFLFDVERVSPGFGGFYLDRQFKVHVFMKRGGDTEGAIRTIRETFSSGKLPSPLGMKISEYVGEIAQFSISELAESRDALFQAVNEGRLPSAVSLDLSEQSNRVALAVENAEGKNTARALLRDLGTDEAKVTLEVRSRPRETRGVPSVIDGIIDTIAGGVAVRWGSSDGCTSGFVAWRSSVKGVVTASHCSSQEWNTDATSMFNDPYGFRQIGTETYDPAGYSCGFRTCRGSDASFYTLQSGVEGNVGLLARMDSLNRRNFDSANPYWIITAVEQGLYYGLPLEKTGATTGRTIGYTGATCFDYMNDGVFGKTRTCQAHAVLIVNDGDSGGPVYWLNTSRPRAVTLAGIASAKSDTTLLIFSPFQRIATNLGLSQWDVIRVATLNSPITSGSVVSGHARLDWSAVSGAAEYKVTVIDYTQQCFEDWGCMYQTSGYGTYTTSSTYFADPRSSFGVVHGPYDTLVDYTEIVVEARSNSAFSLLSVSVKFERF